MAKGKLPPFIGRGAKAPPPPPRRRAPPAMAEGSPAEEALDRQQDMGGGAPGFRKGGRVSAPFPKGKTVR